jgi:hypothetical protein
MAHNVVLVVLFLLLLLSPCWIASYTPLEDDVDEEIEGMPSSFR